MDRQAAAAVADQNLDAHGAALGPQGGRGLTHCNAGALATAGDPDCLVHRELLLARQPDPRVERDHAPVGRGHEKFGRAAVAGRDSCRRQARPDQRLSAAGARAALQNIDWGKDKLATRSAGQQAMAAFSDYVPTMVGGAADLSESTKTEFPGGHELNYVSDVDVIFVAEPVKDEDETAALATASRLAAGMIGVCARSTPEGSIFPVDPNLRPEGRAGPLVRTLTSHLAYYERWAKTWEFQALLKARPVAGDMALGQAYADTLGPLVWQAARREHFVEDVQAMRRRVEQSLPARQAGRELKLGPGGLRDIEFAVQLLQLVHGRTDEALRSPATLPSLAALAAGGYVGRADADELGAAYRFLRRTEHLLQLNRLSRTHTLPEDPAVLRRLGRAMRSNDEPNPYFLDIVQLDLPILLKLLYPQGVLHYLF